MAQVSEDFLSALYKVRASELENAIAAEKRPGIATALKQQLQRLPQEFGSTIQREINKPAGETYERGFERLQGKIAKGGPGAQLALGKGADVIGENLRTLYEGKPNPVGAGKNLNLNLTQSQIQSLQEMGYDPYEYLSEGAPGRGGNFILPGLGAREGTVQFSGSTAFNPVSADFFSGLGLFVDPSNSGRLDDVTNYGLSTTDPRERFAQQAEQAVYRRAAGAASRGVDEQQFLAQLQRDLPGRYEQRMSNFEDVLAPQGQTLGSADPYRQQIQNLQGGLGSIVRSAYGTVRPAVESGTLAPTFNQFRNQAVQATGVKDPIALQQYYQTNVAPSYQYSRAGFDPSGNFGLIESSQDEVLSRNMQRSMQSPAMQKIMADPQRQAAYGQLQSAYQTPQQGAPVTPGQQAMRASYQAPTPNAGKGASKGNTAQQPQRQTAQNMFSGFN